MKQFIKFVSIVALTIFGIGNFNTCESSYYFQPGAKPTGGFEGTLKFINNSDKPLEICKLSNFGIEARGFSPRSYHLFYKQKRKETTQEAFTDISSGLNLKNICMPKNIQIMQPHEIISIDHVKYGMWQDPTSPIMAHTLSEMIIPNIPLNLSPMDMWNLIVPIAKSMAKPYQMLDLATMKIISSTEPGPAPIAPKIKVQTPDEFKKEVEKMTNDQLMKTMTEYINTLAETVELLQKGLEKNVAYARSPEDIKPQLRPEDIKPRLDIITAEITKRLGR